MSSLLLSWRPLLDGFDVESNGPSQVDGFCGVLLRKNHEMVCDGTIEFEPILTAPFFGHFLKSSADQNLAPLKPSSTVSLIWIGFDAKKWPAP